MFVSLRPKLYTLSRFGIAVPGRFVAKEDGVASLFESFSYFCRLVQLLLRYKRLDFRLDVAVCCVEFVSYSKVIEDKLLGITTYFMCCLYFPS